jgi:hypothetical protein
MKNLHTLLQSNKIDDIHKGLSMAETNASLKDLSLILELLAHPEMEQFEVQIIELVSNVSYSKANEIIIEYFKKFRHSNKALRALFQMAWQSRLDFSSEMEYWVELFLEADYLTSIEAFTLIENIWQDYSYTPESKAIILSLLRPQLKSAEEHKHNLISALIKTIETTEHIDE